VAEKPEEVARVEIDKLLAAAGWSVQPVKEANIHAARGVALCNFPLKDGHGFADYMLYWPGPPPGTTKAKRAGNVANWILL